MLSEFYQIFTTLKLLSKGMMRGEAVHVSPQGGSVGQPEDRCPSKVSACLDNLQISFICENEHKESRRFYLNG